MRRMLVLTLLLLRGVAAAEGGIVWCKDVAEAKKAAQEKRPIAVVLVQKGCPLSGELLKNLDVGVRWHEGCRRLIRRCRWNP